MTKKDKCLLREFLECQKRNNREVSVIAPLNGSIIVTGKIGRIDCKSVEIGGYIIPTEGCIFKVNSNACYY